MSDPTVLLTGATGFIGGATLSRLLHNYPACRVLLLVRGESPEAAAARVRQSISRFADLARLESALTPPSTGRMTPVSQAWPYCYQCDGPTVGACANIITLLLFQKTTHSNRATFGKAERLSAARISSAGSTYVTGCRRQVSAATAGTGGLTL
jgi:hypothetical protein